MWNLRYSGSVPRGIRTFIADKIAEREKDKGFEVETERLFDATRDRVLTKVWTREKDECASR